ncbi:MAG: coproporphyrinogen dehydrogenase HemZ [Lachnospiraceae bacterium]|nr:coproporphyrinogen dehydrogenase HemZ [Lachnospiraceae bacterium]
MIHLYFNKVDYEYDVRGLLNAFYPGEPVATHAGLNGRTPAGEKALKVAFYPERTEVRFRGADGWRRRTAAGTVSGRQEKKNVLKRLIYGLLVKETGRSLPWGTLTGIRPTKIVMGFLETGRDIRAIDRYLEDEYRVSEEKRKLAIGIAGREREILKEIDYENGYSLYIGIPFCPTTCLYCSFTSYPIGKWSGRMEEYLAALFRELDYTAEAFSGRNLNAVYLGGGTPTTLTADQMDRLLGRVEETFDLSALREFTVEAGRPDSITEEKLAAIRGHRVSRISLNPQSMNQKTLDLIGRRHTTEQIREVYGMARDMGFDNINMDLILGLPGEGAPEVRHTMEEVAALGPDNLTVHSLAVKRASRLNLEWEKYAEISMENSKEIMDMTAGYADRMGLEPYYLYRQKSMAGNLENVGYARPGKAGIYNILIMEEKQTIVACGAGATSKAVFEGSRIERCENVKDVALYLEKTDEMIERKRRLFAGKGEKREVPASPRKAAAEFGADREERT